MVRLCQRHGSSCGACCGLYATARPGRAATTAELRRRTRALEAAERTVAGFRQAGARLAAQGPAPLIPTVAACPLLGFLDEAGTRVGCLAHPVVTGGPDLRAAGAYDAETCESFLCPSHALLAEDEARLVEAACPGWHRYGMVVTDAPFVRAALAAVAEAVGESVGPGHLDHAPFRAALGRVLALKAELEPGSEGLCGCFSSGRPAPGPAGGGGGGTPPGLEAAPAIPRDPGVGEGAAPHQRLVAALGADERSGNDVERLEAEARRRLAACAAAFPAQGPPGGP